MGDEECVPEQIGLTKKVNRRRRRKPKPVKKREPDVYQYPIPLEEFGELAITPSTSSEPPACEVPEVQEEVKETPPKKVSKRSLKYRQATEIEIVFTRETGRSGPTASEIKFATGASYSQASSTPVIYQNPNRAADNAERIPRIPLITNDMGHLLSSTLFDGNKDGKDTTNIGYKVASFEEKDLYDATTSVHKNNDETVEGIKNKPPTGKEKPKVPPKQKEKDKIGTDTKGKVGKWQLVPKKKTFKSNTSVATKAPVIPKITQPDKKIQSKRGVKSQIGGSIDMVDLERVVSRGMQLRTRPWEAAQEKHNPPIKQLKTGLDQKSPKTSKSKINQDKNQSTSKAVNADVTKMGKKKGRPKSKVLLPEASEEKAIQAPPKPKKIIYDPDDVLVKYKFPSKRLKKKEDLNEMAAPKINNKSKITPITTPMPPKATESSPKQLTKTRVRKIVRISELNEQILIAPTINTANDNIADVPKNIKRERVTNVMGPPLPPPIAVQLRTVGTQTILCFEDLMEQARVAAVKKTKSPRSNKPQEKQYTGLIPNVQPETLTSAKKKKNKTAAQGDDAVITNFPEKNKIKKDRVSSKEDD